MDDIKWNQIFPALLIGSLIDFKIMVLCLLIIWMYSNGVSFEDCKKTIESFIGSIADKMNSKK